MFIIRTRTRTRLIIRKYFLRTPLQKPVGHTNPSQPKGSFSRRFVCLRAKSRQVVRCVMANGACSPSDIGLRFAKSASLRIVSTPCRWRGSLGSTREARGSIELAKVYPHIVRTELAHPVGSSGRLSNRLLLGLGSRGRPRVKAPTTELAGRGLVSVTWSRELSPRSPLASPRSPTRGLATEAR